MGGTVSSTMMAVPRTSVIVSCKDLFSNAPGVPTLTIFPLQGVRSAGGLVIYTIRRTTGNCVFEAGSRSSPL